MTDIKMLERKVVPIDQVDPWEKNPRNIKKANYERLKAQIIELAIYKPLLCARRDGRWVTIGGNQRLLALRELQQTQVEIAIIETQDEAMWLKYALSDNDFVGETDEQRLAELAYPHIQEINLKTYHVTVVEPVPLENVLEEFGPELNEPAEDSVPPEEVGPAKTKRGDLFTLGEHRLLCGDATNADDVKRLMGDQVADAVFTDPPYNVDYKGTKFDKIKGDKQSPEQFVEFSLKFFKQIKETLKPGGAYYVCSGYSSYPTFVYAIHKIGLVFSTPIVWVKNNTSLGWGDYRHKHEMLIKGRRPVRRPKKAQPIIYGWNEGKHYFADTRFEADVWEARRRASQTMLHPTQKPVALIRRALKNSTREKEIVQDLFAGSGSTAIGAAQTKRRAFMMELDPKFCDTIIKRYAHFTRTREATLRKTRDQG